MFSAYHIVLIHTLAILPAIGWITVYRYLDCRDPEPVRATVFALVMGMLSTLPVFAMQYVFSNYPQYDLVTLLQSSLQTPLVFTSIFLMFVAVVEELMKAIAFIFVIKRYERAFNQIVDGILYGAMIGIGFALTENVYYFFKAASVFSYSGSFLAVFSIRSFGTMLAHTLFTALFGFYFAKAYFSPLIEEESRSHRLWHNVRHNLKHAVKLHATFFHLLPGTKKDIKSFHQNAVIFEGFIVAILVHFFYNAFIKLEFFGKNWTFLIIPLVFLVAWYVWSRFFVRLYTRIISFVKIRGGMYRMKAR